MSKKTTFASNLKSQILQSNIKSQTKEKLIIFYLDDQYQLINDETFSINLKNKIYINPKTIFRSALKDSSPAFIIVHNHPSGDCLPSKKDITFTNRMKKMARIIGITVVDHIIVSKDDQFSFAENGLI